MPYTIQSTVLLDAAPIQTDSNDDTDAFLPLMAVGLITTQTVLARVLCGEEFVLRLQGTDLGIAWREATGALCRHASGVFGESTR
jgi:hypothetical protein